MSSAQVISYLMLVFADIHLDEIFDKSTLFQQASTEK